MADTQASQALTPQQWDSNYFEEYIRKNRYKRYMGSTENAMIQVKEDLTRKPGDSVTFATMRKLKGQGVSGDMTLEGREEELDSRGLKVAVNPLRHAVVVTKWQAQKSAIALRDAMKPALMRWDQERFRDDLIRYGFMNINGKNWFDASPAERNAWLTDNQDRVLVGNKRSNTASNNLATALGLLNTTDGRMTPAVISMAKRMAALASPAIRPITTSGADEEEETFILFCPSWVFRDLKENPTIIDAQKLAMERGKSNPLWRGGDLLWDGVIIKEDPNIPTLGNLGASGANVAMSFFCGAQAVGVAWAQRPQTIYDNRDYNWKRGVAIEMMRGIEKLRFGTGDISDGSNPKDAGMLTIFTVATPDA